MLTTAYCSVVGLLAYLLIYLRASRQHPDIGGDLVQVFFGGERGRRISAEIFFAVPSKMRNLGDGGGLTVSWN